MIKKFIAIILITVIVFFVYEIVRNLWSIDICVSYYQRYGNYNYTIPLTDKQTNTWDCYHAALNNMPFYVVGLIVVSLVLGLIIGLNDVEISIEKRQK
jgi:hypothetical protein